MPLSKADAEKLRHAIQILLIYCKSPAVSDEEREELAHAWHSIERLTDSPIPVPGEDTAAWTFRLRTAAWKVSAKRQSLEDIKTLVCCQDQLRCLPAAGAESLRGKEQAEGIGGESKRRRAGKRRLESSNPIKLQIYQRILQAHQPGKQYLDTIALLKADLQFVEQVREARLKLNAELVRNALAFFDRRNRRQASANQQ